MKLQQRLRSAALGVLGSAGWQTRCRQLSEINRRVRRRRHVVSAFLELDDPYSGLLCHYLQELGEHFDIELRVYLTEAAGGVMRPEPDLYAEYAVMDCRRVAAELGIPFLDKGESPPVEHRVALVDALAASADSADHAAEVTAAIIAYWRGDAQFAARHSEGAIPRTGEAIVRANQQRLQRMGHYDTATLHYAGEWYRGVDRLGYLTERLAELGAAEGGAPPQISAINQVLRIDLPVRPPAAAKTLPPLEFFFSYRSPFSYVALLRVTELADAYGLQLQIRPVLPMVMRGLPVPRAKLRYIAVDAGREARRAAAPFGKLADPLGAGVERCLAVQQYAISQRREREFVQNACELIWSQAVDVATDKGLRKVTAKCGLFWPDVLESLQDDTWRDVVEDNRQALLAAGAWGVPTMRIGDFVVWGQDRVWLLARYIEDQCDAGDGILV